MVAGGRELIDTLWNVNKFSERLSIVISSELIDTLWNVNAGSYKRLLPDKFELIDTLWNVNLFFCSCVLTRTYRINRYIMECKY